MMAAAAVRRRRPRAWEWEGATPPVCMGRLEAVAGTPRSRGARGACLPRLPTHDSAATTPQAARSCMFSVKKRVGVPPTRLVSYALGTRCARGRSEGGALLGAYQAHSRRGLERHETAHSRSVEAQAHSTQFLSLSRGTKTPSRVPGLLCRPSNTAPVRPAVPPAVPREANPRNRRNHTVSLPPGTLAFGYASSPKMDNSSNGGMKG